MNRKLRILEIILWTAVGPIVLSTPEVSKWQYALTWMILMSEMIDKI
jgi:hypothetical protein